MVSFLPQLVKNLPKKVLHQWVHTKDSIFINKNYLNDFYKRKIIMPSKIYARWPKEKNKAWIDSRKYSMPDY
jgi:hypothetical protein